MTSTHECHQKDHCQQTHRHAKNDQGCRIGAFEFFDALRKISWKLFSHSVVSPCKADYQPIHPSAQCNRGMKSIYSYWCRAASVVSTMSVALDQWSSTLCLLRDSPCPGQLPPRTVIKFVDNLPSNSRYPRQCWCCLQCSQNEQ